MHHQTISGFTDPFGCELPNIQDEAAAWITAGLLACDWNANNLPFNLDAFRLIELKT
jgi:hypothetical protein